MTERAGRVQLRPLPRGLALALCGTALVWAAAARLVASRSAAGIALRLHVEPQQSLLESGFLLFLVVIGFQVLDWLAVRGVAAREGRPDVLPLPRRRTAGVEWLSGAAIGWGMSLAAIVPAMLFGRYHAQVNHGPGVPIGVLTTMATLLLVSLAEETVFRGYPLQVLGRALGPGLATVILSGLFAVVLVGGSAPVNLGGALLNLFSFGLLLSMAYLRTRALWLGWGLHLGFRAVMVVLFGLPVAGRADLASLMDGTLRGPRWVTGGGFGLDAALPTLAVLLSAMMVLYRVSRDWAWVYTAPEIVAGGYEVTVAPPAAHTAMEKAAAPPPLVQILPVTAAPPPPVFSRDAERES